MRIGNFLTTLPLILYQQINALVTLLGTLFHAGDHRLVTFKTDHLKIARLQLQQILFRALCNVTHMLHSLLQIDKLRLFVLFRTRLRLLLTRLGLGATLGSCRSALTHLRRGKRCGSGGCKICLSSIAIQTGTC